MKCGDIEEILPGYLDGALSEEEKRKVEEHLALCPGCRECLADLEKAVALAGDMERLEPPARFTEDIMARVRKEADLSGEPGFFRKLFFPLHVKVPLQAFATVCIAVLAMYVYHSVGPGMRALEDQPARVQDSRQVQENVPPATEGMPAAEKPEAAKAAPGKAAEPAKEKQGRAGGAVKAMPRDAAAPGRELKMESPAPPSPARAYEEEAREEAAAAEGVAAPRNQVQASPAAPKPAQASKKTELQGLGASAQIKDAPLPVHEDKAEKARDAQPLTKSLAEPDQVPEPTGAALMKSKAALPVVTVTLVVADLDEGVRAVEKILAGLPARVVSREMLAGRVVLVSEIPARQVSAYVKQAGAAGRIEGKSYDGPVSEGSVRVRTVVTSQSE